MDGGVTFLLRTHETPKMCIHFYVGIFISVAEAEEKKKNNECGDPINYVYFNVMLLKTLLCFFL